MKIFSIQKLFSKVSGNETGRIEVDPRWLRDPLSHPDLDAMSLTELADLPLSLRALQERSSDRGA